MDPNRAYPILTGLVDMGMWLAAAPRCAADVMRVRFDMSLADGHALQIWCGRRTGTRAGGQGRGLCGSAGSQGAHVGGQPCVTHDTEG
jgi:hypothetical protein